MVRSSRSSFVGLVLMCSAALAADPAHDMHAMHAAKVGLTQPGQAAFAALQEVVAYLEADPTTDWTKVNITRLRDHLVDMDEVVMRADARLEETSEGARIFFTGEGRVLAAVKRMIPAHAAMMNGYHDWVSKTESSDTGVIWTIATASNPERVRIRALGPFGLLTLGSHHVVHHLALAKGEVPHT